VAPLDVTVLLLGQSGTGKTHFARVIHESSPRAGKPFVQFTCGGMSETVVEGELFGVAGTERSAPVGPLAGGLAVADEGTLLLEDVANLPPPTQARLLHVLQPPALPPPGTSPTLPVGVRVLAATDVDLAAAVAAGSFREDLYQRLAILPIRLPSLAERREDIAPLAAHFARLAAERHGLPHLALSPAAVRTLEAMEWPGNVRQLANAVEIGAIRAAGGGAHSIERSHLVGEDHQGPLTLQEATRRFQTRFLREVLESAEWNVDDVASRLELPRSHVYSLIRAFGLERAKRRGEP
jgi:Nif-specific regulatory protein